MKGKKFVVSKVDMSYTKNGKRIQYAKSGDLLWVTNDGGNWYRVYYVNGVSVEKLVKVGVVIIIQKYQVDER